MMPGGNDSDQADNQPDNPASAALIKTYSLQEVAAMVLPPDLKSPERWLQARLKSGEISGYKIGRTWRMTHRDVEDLIERHRNNVRPRSNRIAADGPEPESEAVTGVPIINGLPYGGLTRRSWLYHTRANTPGTTQYNRRHGIPPPSPQPEPRSYKKVKPESEAVIFNMPELSDIQKDLLERVRREREVVVGNDHRKTVESLVRRNLVSYTVATGYGRSYQFTVRLLTP